MNVVFARTEEIDQDLRKRLYALYSQVYISDEATFLRSFNRLTHQAIAYDDGEVVGFSSVDIRLLPHAGKKIVSIYFGNSIIAHAARNKGIVQEIVWKGIFRATLLYPLYPKYLFCHASTYKPYLFYAKKIRRSYPKVGAEVTDDVLALRDTLVANCPAQIGQDGWKSTKRVNWELNDDTVAIRDEDLLDPDIEFFHELNPTGRFGVYTFAPASVSNMVAHLWTHVIKPVLRPSSRRRSGGRSPRGPIASSSEAPR